MSGALTAAEVEVVRQYLAQTTDFRIFPLLAETILWGKFHVLRMSPSLRLTIDRSDLYRSYCHHNSYSHVGFWRIQILVILADPLNAVRAGFDLALTRSCSY